MNLILSILTLVAQLTIILIILNYLIYGRRVSMFSAFIFSKAIPFAFFVALVATLGSLYYSEIANFTPCELCWYQRIFVYPQVVLLGLAWWRKEDRIIDYSLILIAIGSIISLYHNYIYYFANSDSGSTTCSIIAPCTQQYITGLGYVTIPLMALTALLLIRLLLLGRKLTNNSNNG